MARTNIEKDGFEQIPLRMSRVFAALSVDLVTKDAASEIELVKNSYNEFAQNVWLRFCDDPSPYAFLEIENDGVSTTREISRMSGAFLNPSSRK